MGYFVGVIIALVLAGSCWFLGRYFKKKKEKNKDNDDINIE